MIIVAFLFYDLVRVINDMVKETHTHRFTGKVCMEIGRLFRLTGGHVRVCYYLLFIAIFFLSDRLYFVSFVILFYYGVVCMEGCLS